LNAVAPKHIAHIGDGRDIPFGNIAIERCRSGEHISHADDGRDVPFGNIAIETLLQTYNSSADGRDIPFGNIPLNAAPSNMKYMKVTEETSHLKYRH
jgi:hypothetical protein